MGFMGVVLFIFNSLIGVLLTLDLYQFIGDVAWPLFGLQMILYVVCLCLYFVKTENKNLKITIVLLRYIALSTALINVLLELAYNRFPVIIGLLILACFIFMIFALYSDEDYEEKLRKYARGNYVILNFATTLLTIGMIFWMMFTMIMWQ